MNNQSFLQLLHNVTEPHMPINQTPDLAFPFHGSDADRYPTDPGMTLLDYLAAQAMQAFCNNSDHSHWPAGELDDRFANNVANASYKMAKAMILAKQNAETR